MQKIIRAEIGIQIDDEKQFYKNVASYYDCDESEIFADKIYGFLNDHIEAHSTIENVFRIVGGDTDGWLLNNIKEA